MARQFILLRLNPSASGWWNGCLSTMCHTCGIACQQSGLRMFTDPGYLRSEDGVV